MANRQTRKAELNRIELAGIFRTCLMSRNIGKYSDHRLEATAA